MKAVMTEKRVAASFVVFLFVIICAMHIGNAGIKTRNMGKLLPETGDPDRIEFTIEETWKQGTGTLISGKCFRPDEAKTYYNFGDELVFDGVYARIAFVIFHDGEAIEIPTHARLLSNPEEEEIYGVCEYDAFLPEGYEEDLANGDAALIWRSADREEIFYLKDQTARTGDEEADEE